MWASRMSRARSESSEASALVRAWIRRVCSGERFLVAAHSLNQGGHGGVAGRLDSEDRRRRRMRAGPAVELRSRRFAGGCDHPGNVIGCVGLESVLKEGVALQRGQAGVADASF